MSDPNRVVSILDRLGDRLWCLGRDQKYLRLMCLWEHPLNSIIVCPIVFEEGSLLHGKLVLNGRVRHDVNNLLLFAVESASPDHLVSQAYRVR